MDVFPNLVIQLRMRLDVQTMMRWILKQWGSVPRFASQWNDSDWDGYGDNINGYQGDALSTY